MSEMPPPSRNENKILVMRPAQQVSDPPPRLVVRPVVDQVAALAKALQIARPVVSRIVIEMGGREDDTGLPQPGCLLDIGAACRLTAAVAPGLASGVVPSGRQQMVSPCGRPQTWQLPPARSNRTWRLICGQSIG
jgi:hypothetical protein